MLVLRGLILRLTKSCGVSDPAEQSSAGYHTPGNNSKYKYFSEFETEFKNTLGYEFGTIWVRFMEKTRGQKSRATVPLKDSIFTRFLKRFFINQSTPSGPFRGTLGGFHVLKSFRGVIATYVELTPR